MKKYLALSLAALLLLCFAAGCSLTTGDPEASPTPAVTDESDSTYDLTAVVAEIGDEKITLGEVKETFDSYISYFTNYGYDLSSDPEMRAMLLDDVVNSLVEAKLISVKANELGYAEFDEEEQAELQERIESELEELDAYYRAQAESEAESDPNIDVDERTMELILEEAAYNMGDEDATYDEYAAFLTETVTDTYIQELLQNDQLKDVALTEEQIQAEYDSLVEEQMTYYAETPEAYKYDEEAFEKSGTAPVAYAPEGYSRILHIFCAFEDALPSEYEANEADMALIEDEYGALAFAAALDGTAGDAGKMQELVAQYKELQSANEAMYEEYSAAAREKANDLYAQLNNGADFATLVQEESSPDNYSDYLIFSEKGILIAPDYACDDDWSDVVKEQFSKLSIGTYSEPFADEDGYHIIYYLADEPAGTVELSSIEEGIRGYLLEEIRTTEWEAIIDAWMNDGTVTLHEDVYNVLLDA